MVFIGVITFTDDAKGNAKQVLVQVKSGHVNSGLIRDFRGTIERENNAVMGIFITPEKPSKNMETKALEAGYYVSPFTNQKHRKIQILTIEDILDIKEPDLPVSASFSINNIPYVKLLEFNSYMPYDKRKNNLIFTEWFLQSLVIEN